MINYPMTQSSYACRMIMSWIVKKYFLLHMVTQLVISQSKYLASIKIVFYNDRDKE